MFQWMESGQIVRCIRFERNRKASCDRGIGAWVKKIQKLLQITAKRSVCGDRLPLYRWLRSSLSDGG